MSGADMMKTWLESSLDSEVVLSLGRESVLRDVRVRGLTVFVKSDKTLLKMLIFCGFSCDNFSEAVL